MQDSPVKHWCEFEFISKTVTNPNIHIRGNYSYYSAYWDSGFERCVVRYLHDKPSTVERPIDQLYIGNFVSFGAECVIMMGGNQLHRTDWIAAFPFDTRRRYGDWQWLLDWKSSHDYARCNIG